MRYQVPQFIDTEVRLIGPFTLRQFLFLATGAVIIFMLHFALSGVYFILVSLPVAVIFTALAFVKIEGLSLARYIGISLAYMFNSRRYVYGNETGEQQFEGFIPPTGAAPTEAAKPDPNAPTVLEKFGT